MEEGNKKNLIFQVIRNGMGLKAKNVDNIGIDKKKKPTKRKIKINK